MRFFLPRPWLLALSVVGVCYAGYALMLAPPSDFPSGKVMVIKRGEDVAAIAHTLADARLVAHPTVLQLILRSVGAENTVQAGAYRFSMPENVLRIAYRLSIGKYDIPAARITFVEGGTVRKFADQVAAALPGITAAEFSAAAAPYEGYLFPDTYTFPPGIDTDSVIATMRVQFTKKTAALMNDIAASGHTLSDIVILASLVEREARTVESRRMVAGILWHRLSLGMPLQVDAVFGYIFDRPTYSPSFADLKVDSPYNTYTHKGLPPGPIANPGLESIEAAVYPAQTAYLYYLTGRDGQMHYASTYAQHQANQRKYLQ